MGQRVQAHLKTLANDPPVQGGKSFDRSNAVEEVLRKGNQ